MSDDAWKRLEKNNQELKLQKPESQRLKHLEAMVSARDAEIAQLRQRFEALGLTCDAAMQDAAVLTVQCDQLRKEMLSCYERLLEVLTALSKAGVPVLEGENAASKIDLLSSERDHALIEFAAWWGEAEHFKDLFKRTNNVKRQQRANARALAEALGEAGIDMADWAQYAGDYYKERHGLEDDLKALGKVLSEHGAQYLQEIKK